MEKAYEIRLISGTDCEDGRHFVELMCVGEDNKVISVVIPVTNSCENISSGDMYLCSECGYRGICELTDPYEIELGRRLLIMERE